MPFINTKYKDTVENMVGGLKERFKNPLWYFSDKKPTFVTYYRINKEKSTLDSGLQTEYERLGSNSPLRFNKIENFTIYGLERIELSYNDGDYGVEADEVDGNITILPNTIEPVPGDYFVVNYIKDPILFRINSVSIDMLDDGSNFWTATYEIDRTDESSLAQLNKQVVENYSFIINNVGTDYKSVIKSSDYNLIAKLEEGASSLVDYYIEIFYDTNVQAFIFEDMYIDFYDAYMTEFLIRNRLLIRDRNKYIHVAHQLHTKKTFSLDYANTIFRAFETKNKNILDGIYYVYHDITEPDSLFYFRLNMYKELDYCRTRNNAIDIETRSCVNPHVVERIKSGVLFRPEENMGIYNTFIKYFNDMEITAEDFAELDNLSLYNGKDIFYIIPLYLFVIGDYIKSLLANI